MMSFDYDAFAAWMESRKYAHRTIVGARSNLRRALRHYQEFQGVMG